MENSGKSLWFIFVLTLAKLSLLLLILILFISFALLSDVVDGDSDVVVCGKFDVDNVFVIIDVLLGIRIRFDEVSSLFA